MTSALVDYRTPTRPERRYSNAILARESEAYNSPIIKVAMKQPTKNETFHANLALAKEDRPLPAVGGVIHDKKQYKKDKETIRKGIASFVETGTALARVRDSRSFELDEYQSFEEFCEREYGFSPQYGNRLIAASDDFKALSPESQKLLVSETHVTALAKTEPEQRDEIVAEVAAEAKESGKKVTAKAIEKKIEEKKKKTEPEPAEFRELIKDAAGNEVPENRVEKFKLAEKMGKENRQKAKEILNALESDDVLVVEARGLAEVAKDLHAGLGQNLTRHVMCPKCEWKGCSVCHKRGFVSKYFADKGIGK